MYNQVLFFNHFGTGDIFESREFVKEWMKLVPANKYCYSHGKNIDIVKDIEELEFKELTEHMHPGRGVWDDSNGNLYVNTWIGRDGQYVLPGIGCTIEQLFRMHNDLLRVYSLGTLSGTAVDYIPSINYTKYDIKSVDKFIKEHPEDKVFISNGPVQSNQAMNFSFMETIYRLAGSYKEKCFIITDDLPVQMNNVYPTSWITKNTSGCDLNELSYISTFCSTIIGRSSGPFTFAQVKENCMDSSKKLVSFTYKKSGASFVENTAVKIQKYWSDATREDLVFDFISGVLG